MKIAFLSCFIFTLFNTGLIWTIQLVHYPGFLHIGSDTYKAYQEFHMRAITLLVGPSMLAELAATVLITMALYHSPYRLLIILSALVLIFIWLHTAFLASPLHGKLLNGFQPELIRKLVDINWWRTIAWSIRSAILIYLAYRIF